MFRLFLFFIILLPLSPLAQQLNLKKGQLSGSMESSSALYRDDEGTGAQAPSDKIGSNSYLTLKYKIGKFSAGAQYEAYLPAMQGFSNRYNGNALVFRYASYKNDWIGITLGNYYEQFGSGLILRTYEDRQLGINTAFDGANIQLTPIKGIRIKGLYGKQRKYLENGDGYVRGADAEFSIADFVGWENVNLAFGGSFVNRYEVYTGPETDFPEAVDAHAGRMTLNTGAFNFSMEYVHKSTDPNENNEYKYKEGNALLIETGFSKGPVGINLTGRRLENIDFRSEREAVETFSSINYLPALTRQHRYSLANIYPYATQANGEIGGQAQLSYLFKRKSTIGGKYGMSILVNASAYYNLKVTSYNDKTGFESDYFAVGNHKLYQDINVEISRKWSKKFKSELAYINLEYDKGRLEGGSYPIVKADIVATDLLYKISRKNSVRLELQHLWTKQDHENWASGTLEFGFAPHWTVFVADMYNYGHEEPIHYYSGGGSYTKGSTRILLSYGRQREGLLCVGGVCRMVPAYTGFTLGITTNF